MGRRADDCEAFNLYIKEPNMSLRTATYTVQPGDTLSAIALRFYGAASLFKELAAANGIENPDHIEAGQKITLPEFAA